MASVSSLDKDMRNIRLSKYTAQAANEVRAWIEGVLGEPLAAGDVLEALKDGTALCKLINLVSPSSNVRFKSSSMPFVQMENISHFLRACQEPPISLHSHDIFQTVDLYESKDPAQVLQCIAAFSRQAHAVQPSRFPTALGGARSKGGAVTPQNTGGSASAGTTPRQYSRVRGSSNTSETSSATSYATSQASSQAIAGRGSPSRAFETTPPQSNGGSATSKSSGVSSWSKRQDEGATTPAWNIHQYGYMGGASQGNQGIMFGGRRQITSPAPKVPSLAEKERKRKEQELEAERLRLQAQEAEHKRRVEREAEKEREKAAEERKWEEETRKQREAERLRVEEEKRRWEAEERRWKEEEEARLREEKDAEQQQTPATRPQLQGQFLSQYKAEQQQQQQRKSSTEESQRAVESARVKELERQLEEAKEREAKYERERHERILADSQRSRPSSQLVEEERHPRPISIDRGTASLLPYGSHMSHDNDNKTNDDNERSLLKQAWEATNSTTNQDPSPPTQPSRPLPSPTTTAIRPPQPPRPQDPSSPPPPLLPTRPLPNPASYARASPSSSPTRKSPFTRPSPAAAKPPASPSTTFTPPPSSPNSTAKPQSHPSSSSSLLARERELTLARQAEWAAAQEATAAQQQRQDPLGPAGEGWDIHQYGYLGGDSQNRGDVGIGLGGGGRRQLVGADPGAGRKEEAGNGRRVGGPREMPR